MDIINGLFSEDEDEDQDEGDEGKGEGEGEDEGKGKCEDNGEGEGKEECKEEGEGEGEGDPSDDNDKTPAPDDGECNVAGCEEFQEWTSLLLGEQPEPTNPENPVSDPDDGVVTTTPREDVQIGFQEAMDERLAPLINPGDTEGDVDDSILPVGNPVLDPNHNPEPVDPQPQLSDELTISETIAGPDGTVGSTPNGSFMH